MTRQFHVKTLSYSWSYDIEERPNTECKRVGIISLDGMRQRTLAITRGEYNPPLSEPKCWFSPKEKTRGAYD